VTGLAFASLPTGTLKALHLTDTKISGAELSQLPPMPNLETLKLNRLNADDDTVESLALYPHLRHVELDATPLTDAGLRRLFELLPALERVEARNTAVTAETARELGDRYRAEIAFESW
jgi:hypothetical protein